MRPKKQGKIYHEFRRLFESNIPCRKLKGNTSRVYTSRMTALAERHDIPGQSFDIYSPSWLDDPDALIEHLRARQSINSVRTTLSACITYLRRIAAVTDSAGAKAIATVLEGVYRRKLRRIQSIANSG